ncbi:hybrid sensor histidine kinase/response regulator [Actinoplanes sp. HUAS TT8]|uniref:hybrid sensor histidine kinase/response regulator n=1 Tax=Actinoplanes sp. HUAS TT8 TaxID=3447453 RepID=UPI003F526422
MKLPKPHSAYVIVAALTVTVLAMFAVVAPSRMLVFGMLAVGPVLAVASANPRAVLGVGAYALAASAAISTWKGLRGTEDQMWRLLMVAALTGVSWAIAGHLRSLLRTAAAAAQEREMLAALVRQSADAIIVMTLDGVVTIWNVGAEHLYGYAASQVVGTRFTKVLPQDRVHVLAEGLAKIAAGESILLDESRRIDSEGRELLVNVAVSPIRDEHGRVVAAAATERDVTEKKRREAEEKLALERSARTARLESLGQLAGGVAHDFNNLLAIILNYADFLGDEVTPDGSRDLARIRDAADRARSLTGQLLLFAKREPTDVTTVDLNEVATCSNELLSRTIGANIRLICRPHAQPLMVRANRGRLDQILLNLVINARDAMPDGGVIVVETGRRPDSSALLTVSDTGCGMTPEVRDRLFEPFFTTKPADRGTGLGLATVYGIVGDAGGQINVESEPGIGTTFQILLPLAVEAEEEPAGVELTGPAPGHGEHIVVIEDEEYVHDLVVRILRENGYRTTTLDECDPADVALVISDVMLRDQSGPEIAERLRAANPELRVLFMSGYSDEELRTRYDLDTSTRIVQKPFTAVELLAAVGETLAPTLDQCG